MNYVEMHSIIYLKRNTQLPIFKISSASKWSKKNYQQNYGQKLLSSVTQNAKNLMAKVQFVVFCQSPFIKTLLKLVSFLRPI